jgi:hypothetical protein
MGNERIAYMIAFIIKESLNLKTQATTVGWSEAF